jgi:hypothetical protein
LFASLEYLRKRLALPSWTSGTHSPSFPEILTEECETEHGRRYGRQLRQAQAPAMVHEMQ